MLIWTQSDGRPEKTEIEISSWGNCLEIDVLIWEMALDFTQAGNTLKQKHRTVVSFIWFLLL